MPMNKFFRFPFATTGDKTAIPDATQPSGDVSFEQGYGPDYARDPATDPLAKNIERDKMNQLFFDVTTAISEIQSQGVPDFINSALNGGSAYSYGANAVVRYSGEVYVSLVGSNTALPTDATKWAKLPTALLIQNQAFTSANASGSGNAITATFSPAVAPVNGTTVYVRATVANTSTVTFSPNGVTARAVVKGNDLPLVAGDIAGPGHWLELTYDSTLVKWVLQNPARGVNVAVNYATETAPGIIEIATLVEVQSGTDATRAVTPATLAGNTASTTRAGVVRLSTFGEAQAGTDISSAVTPAALASVVATQTQSGLIELATIAEVQAGTDTSRAVTPATLAANTASTTRSGVIELATFGETQAGTDISRAVTPAGLRAGFNASGDAPVFAPRAWVCFNGTGTLAIKASGNVSSVTDNGTGNYTVNFTTAMQDANYSAVGSCNAFNNQAYIVCPNSNNLAYFAPTTSACRITTSYAGAIGDIENISLAIFR